MRLTWPQLMQGVWKLPDVAQMLAEAKQWGIIRGRCPLIELTFLGNLQRVNGLLFSLDTEPSGGAQGELVVLNQK